MGILWVSPAEVIQDRGMIDVSANRDQVPERLINGASAHPIGIPIAVRGIKSIRDDDRALRIKPRAEHARIGRPALVQAHKRLDDASPLDLMIILTHDPFL